MFFWADINDPDEDPAALLFHSAQIGSIPGIQKAIDKDPKLIYASEIFDGQSALHLAASNPNPTGATVVRWLLEKGIPWSAEDKSGRIAEDSARNEESRKILREWAVQKEYEQNYKTSQGEGNPDVGKPFKLMHFDEDYGRKNELYCTQTDILYTNPNGAPEEEVALVTFPGGSGIMMEWQRPIMRESARLLLEGMPSSGLRVLNIGFGLGMIDSYFQDAKPAEHVIIEGHFGCLGWMRHTGWYDRPGVRVLEGRWQDFFPPHEPESDNDKPKPFDIGKFDIVYFDTYQEGYHGHFSFIKHVPRLLRDQNSRFSYFNGHGAKHETGYQVYAEVARLHHNDLGMNTKWSKVYIDKKTIWENILTRGEEVSYDHPFLIPICALAPTVPRTLVPGIGWRCYPDEGGTEDVDGAQDNSGSDSDVG